MDNIVQYKLNGSTSYAFESNRKDIKNEGGDIVGNSHKYPSNSLEFREAMITKNKYNAKPKSSCGCG